MESVRFEEELFRQKQQEQLGTVDTAEEAEAQRAAAAPPPARSLTSEEALQQAQAEGLTLRAAENRTGYLGVYFDATYDYPGAPGNRMAQRARTKYFGVYLDTTYGHDLKPYKARVNRSGSGELDEWGLHNSSHLADYTTAEAAALAIARNAVEEEWRAHGCEARALRKEVQTLVSWHVSASKRIVESARLSRP